MKIKTLLGVSASLALAASAGAFTVPFTETFEAGFANWRNANNSADLTHVPSGGSDGGGYVFGTFNYANTSVGGFPPIILRGEVGNNASNGAFVGDWLAGGVTVFSFDIRHDAPVALTITSRIATPNNNPGASMETSFAVEPGVWTTVSISIDPNDPQWLSFSNQPFENTFSNVGRIQIGANVAPELAGQNVTVRFDLDRVSIVPTAGTAAAFAAFGLAAARRRRA